MIIRDIYATIENDKTINEYKSNGFEIVADDGKTLYSIRLTEGGRLEISGGSFCKHENVLLDERLIVQPRASNFIHVSRCKYEDI